MSREIEIKVFNRSQINQVQQAIAPYCEDFYCNDNIDPENTCPSLKFWARTTMLGEDIEKYLQILFGEQYEVRSHIANHVDETYLLHPKNALGDLTFDQWIDQMEQEDIEDLLKNNKIWKDSRGKYNVVYDHDEPYNLEATYIFSGQRETIHRFNIGKLVKARLLYLALDLLSSGEREQLISIHFSLLMGQPPEWLTQHNGKFEF